MDSLLEGEIEDLDLLECFFLEALYCSLGASLLEDGRIKFDEGIKRLSSMPTADTEGVWARPGELPGRNLDPFFGAGLQKRWTCFSLFLPVSCGRCYAQGYKCVTCSSRSTPESPLQEEAVPLTPSWLLLLRLWLSSPYLTHSRVPHFPLGSPKCLIDQQISHRRVPYKGFKILREYVCP